MSKSTFVFPYYQVSADGHSIWRVDSAEDEGVIVAFCPNPTEAHNLANGIMRDVEHRALIGVLNSTHDTLRDIREKLDAGSPIPSGA